jgi:hypothetical protein
MVSRRGPAWQVRLDGADERGPGSADGSELPATFTLLLLDVREEMRALRARIGRVEEQLRAALDGRGPPPTRKV